MNDRKKIAMDAHMEGQATIARSIGGKIKISVMEAVVLVNFAEIGLLSVFTSLDGATGASAEEELGKLLDSIRATFGSDGKLNGLERLTETAAAMLRSERFFKFLVRT